MGKKSIWVSFWIMNENITMHYMNTVTFTYHSHNDYMFILYTDASPFTDTNGHITCYFIDDNFMIANNYSTSCVVYYINMSQPVYVIREKNRTASVSFNITSGNVYVSLDHQILPIIIEPGELLC